MNFLLDTDTCIYALKQSVAVLKHLLAQKPEDIAVSIITEAELRAGAAKSISAAKALRLVENFLRPLAILEFSSSDAATYAQVRAKLERAGTPIGPLDTLIAAQAVGRRLVLASNNERQFRRVPGLHIGTGQARASTVRILLCSRAGPSGCYLIFLMAPRHAKTHD